jgi:hypothetical protein
MDKVNLSAPWMTFVHEVQALFDEDEDVKIVYDDSEYDLKLYVEDARKADALTQLLPTEKKFGNVTLKIAVVSADGEESPAQLFEDAFRGNPALEYLYTAQTPFGEIDYAVMKNRVVQFFNDQLDDINGLKSTLYQEIARDVFGQDKGVFFCTAAPKHLEKPLGEWP